MISRGILIGWFEESMLRRLRAIGLAFSCAGLLSGIAYPRALPFSTRTTINVRSLGARGDGRYVSNADVEAGSRELISATAQFQASDVAKPIVVVGAGEVVSGKPNPLVTKIAAVNGPESVTLAVPAVNSATKTWASWGTDDGPAIRKALNATSAGSTTIYFPAGVYRITEVLSLNSSAVRLRGDGVQSVLVMGTVYSSKTSPQDSGDGLPLIFIGQPKGPALSEIEIDHLKFANVGTQVHNPVNGAGLIQALDNATIRNIKIHDLTIETASRCGITLAAQTDGYEIYNVNVVGGLHALYLAGQGRNGYIHDNVLYNVSSLAHLYNSLGIVLKNQRYVRVIHNRIANYGMYGVLLTPEFSDEQIVVDSNIITDVGSGIGVGGENEVTLSNNKIDGTQHYGIWVYGVDPGKVTQQIRIVNNVIQRTAGYGIVAERVNKGHLADVVLQGNKLYDCEGGVQLNGLQGSNVVANNTVTSSSVRKKLLGFYLLYLESSNTTFSHNTSTNYVTSQVPSNILSPNNILR